MDQGSGSGSMLGHRYLLAERLGEGGTGEVYAATDTVTGAQVAAKILSPLSTAAALRHRREVLALRVLQVPGIVRLLDEGTCEGRPYLVMELVAGTPFPGEGRKGWEAVRPVALALLETMARMHAAGVVHRDIKPANVLVDDDGRPVLLDLGLARGDGLGQAITRPNAAVGTPRYESPEQLSGVEVDARSDLYSFGVMLYEVLTGHNPHPTDNLYALQAARIMRDAPPVAYTAPHLPADVCHVIDRLLARLPEARPGSALEVLAALGGEGAGDQGRFPWLGPRDCVDAAVAEVLAGRSYAFSGPGRTRALQEIAAALTRAGRRSASTTRGGRPFESILPLVGAPDAHATDPGAVGEQLRRRLREVLLGGTVVLVDDAEDLDDWSADLLNEPHADGALVWAWRDRADVPRLEPLSEEALRELFHGPDLLLHLREDAARVLHARSRGIPANVVAEVAAWVSGGLAAWRGDRLAMDRIAIDRLEGDSLVHVSAAGLERGARPLRSAVEELLAWVTLAWPHSTPALVGELAGLQGWEAEFLVEELVRVGAVVRASDGRLEPRRASVGLASWPAERRTRAHAAIAARLAPGARGRFAHLVGAGDLHAAAIEAGILASTLARDGYLGRAIAVLSQGLSAAREDGDAAVQRALLVQAAAAALSENSGASLQHVRYELGRSPAEAVPDGLAELLTAALAALAGDAAATRDALAPLGPLPDAELEIWRRALELQVAWRAGLEAAEAYVETCLAWAEADGSALLRGRVLGWKGLLRYRQGRMAEAGAAHVAALPLKEGAADQLSTMLNAAHAWLEAQSFDEARRWAEEARELAVSRRLALFEGRAISVLRAVAYRSGEPMEPDLTLVEAARIVMGATSLLLPQLLNEGAAAWRRGHPAAIGLAEEARDLAVRQRFAETAAAAAALHAAARGADADSWKTIAEEALTLRAGAAAAEVLGLVARAGVCWEPRWSSFLDECLSVAPWTMPAARRVLMAEDEIRAYAEAARARRS